MSFTVACECGRFFEIAESYAGWRARCPTCGHEFTIPPPPPEEVLYIPAEPPRAVTSGKAIASFLVGFLFVFACISGLPAIIFGGLALRDISRNGGRLKGRGLAVAGILLGSIGCLITFQFLASTMPSHHEAARRAQCVNNLKQMGLAFHNYYNAYGCLPPAAITDKDGRPLLSWRVAILPFLEEIAGDMQFHLDKPARSTQFHLDEPWNSPHNLALLEPTPLVFVCPSDYPLPPGLTGYQAVVGPNTAFPPDFTPVHLADFVAGADRTVLVAETQHPVPWTKPDDIPFKPVVPLKGFGSRHSRAGFNALFVDGTVRFLKSSTGF